MLIKFQYPYLTIVATAEEAPRVAIFPWAIPIESKDTFSFYAYWTYWEILSQCFPGITWIEGTLEGIASQRLIQSDLSHLPQSWDRSKIEQFFTDSYKPRYYQSDGIYQILRVKRTIVADDVGLGKTIQSVGAAAIYAYSESVRLGTKALPIIVIVPSGIRSQWRGEILRMLLHPVTGESLYNPGDITVIDGPPGLRKKIYTTRATPWVITSYELLLRDFDAFRSWLIAAGGISTLIIDEASRCKNSASATYAKVATLVQDFRPPMVLALNATPIENGLDELWTQLSLVERTIFPSWPAFEQTYVRTVTFCFCRRCGKYVHKYKMGPHGDTCKQPVTHRWRPDFVRVVGFNDLPGVRSLIRDRYIRRTAAMVNEQLPPIVVTSVYVDLDRDQRRAYDAVRTDPNLDPQVKMGELVRRAAFAFEGTKVRSTKTDALVEIMRELGDAKCVVVAESKVLIRHVSKVLQDNGLNVGEITGDSTDDQRDAIVRSFTHEKMQVICGTSAIERGLNLQAGGVIVNLDIPWNPAKWIQRVGRLRRIGSKHASVRVINVIAKDTVDDLVIERVYQKLGVFNAIFEGDVDEAAFAGKAEVRTLIAEATK